ncbi:MAG: carboxypeptidase-like regulatory domain-containing protein [Bacilli bacterium]|nr:carboxypeptidase-like regulatory domain-containing protein [Bacilli bacterium]
MKKGKLLVAVSMVTPLLTNCGCSNDDCFIKLENSTNCELRVSPDAKAVDSIKFTKGAKNLEFYIYPADADMDKHIHVNSITTGKKDFSGHYEVKDSFHFITDDTKLTDDLIISADAVNTFTVTFHANDGKYSDGTTTRKVNDVEKGEKFGEVLKRLDEKPTRQIKDLLEGWTDINKAPVKDDFVIKDDLTVFANFVTYTNYAIFEDIHEHIDTSNMQFYEGQAYTAFNAAYGLKFNFLFEIGYELYSEQYLGIEVLDITMPERKIPYTLVGNSLSIMSKDIGDHDIIIRNIRASAIQYDVYKPSSRTYLEGIDDSGTPKPTIESGYTAIITFKDGYRVPSRQMVVVTIGGKKYEKFSWDLDPDNEHQIKFIIPPGDVAGTVSYDFYSYELRVAGSVCELGEDAQNPVAGMKVTLISVNGAYSETTSTDSAGYYKFESIDPDVTYEIKIDLSTGCTAGQTWVSNYDTLTISPEEIRDEVNKDFYVANYDDLDDKPLKIKVNDGYANYDISAYNGKAKSTYDGSTYYDIDLKEYDTNLLLKCNLRRTSVEEFYILDMPTIVAPIDISETGEVIDLNIGAYKSYLTLWCCMIPQVFYPGCGIATSRANENFAFMIHSSTLRRDDLTYQFAFTTDNTSSTLNERVFIVNFTTSGEIISITDGVGRKVNHPELVHVYYHDATKEGAFPAIEVSTTADFIRAQGISMTDDQDIYCTMRSSCAGYYGELIPLPTEEIKLDNPTTYPLLKADGSFNPPSFQDDGSFGSLQ